MEDELAQHINECLSNERFATLPVPVIFRVIEKSDRKRVSSDDLYDFIKRSTKRLGVLFSSVDVYNISDERLRELCETISSNEGQEYWITFLKCDVKQVKELRDKIAYLHENLDEARIEIQKLNKANENLQSNLSDSSNEIERLNQEK